MFCNCHAHMLAIQNPTRAGTKSNSSKSSKSYFQNLKKRDMGLVGLAAVGDFGGGVIGVFMVVLM